MLGQDLGVGCVPLGVGWAVQTQEYVVVFVVLDCESIPQEQQSVGEPSVTEEHLGLLKLVLGAAQHQKLVELLLLPGLRKVLDSLFHLFGLAGHLLVLPLGERRRTVHVGFDFAVEPLDQVQVLAVVCLDPADFYLFEVQGDVQGA